MPHLVLSFYLLALVAGTAALSQTFLLWQRHRKLVIRRYGWFLLALYLILLGFLVTLYAQVAGVTGVGSAIIAWILQAGGGLLYIFTGPFFFHSLVGRDVRGIRRAAFYGIDIVVTFVALAAIARPAWQPLTLALSAVLFAMIAWGIAFIAVHLRDIGERTLRRAIVIFLVLSAVFFPLMIIDVAMEFLPGLGFFAFMENLAQPVYFLVLNCLTVAFGLKYLNRPAYADRTGGLTEYFLAAFGVTARERQIIELLLDGAGTKTIAQKLFISAKTAENHVYNIYRKLGVSSRVQMYQLVKTNAIE